MTDTPGAVLHEILSNPRDIDHVTRLTTPDVVYVSLNHDNPDLQRIMPWCGTSHGPESIVQTFVDVGRFWTVERFEIETSIENHAAAAVFGRFTYRSVVLGKSVTTPFSVLARVRYGRCHYLQFMEDTLATSASFRSGGHWTFRSDPDGGEIAF